jgi:arylsulfatase
MLWLLAVAASAQEVLPFPPAPSTSEAGVTIQDSVHRKRTNPSHLPPGAPNILIVLMDDVGPGVPSTYGGEVRTPTLDRVAKMGVSYNRFHSTAMCSPTRASLLTGRNHTRVGNGQVAELANGWDGFSGVIPMTSATSAEVLKNYGYSTGAWGKWHNTPAEQTSAAGPFTYWPTSYGFQYFYGFLAGEASQYEPHLVRNTTEVSHETYEREGYHLTEDLADDAIHWLRQQQALAPDRPVFMYFAPGAAHGPHHVPKAWADKYKGKFDDGWDKYRERVFKRQKALGFIPPDAKLTPRPDSLQAWDQIPESQKPFQRRLMEVFAGFAEHADHNVGRLVDELEKQGRLDNTLIFYIWGDNGSSAEGVNGTISELLSQNGIPTTVDQHIKVLDQMGGLDTLGSPKTDNMFHAGWAWAGSAPFRSTKLVAAHFGGTRQPMAVAWPSRIRHDGKMRPQFHHVIDIAPTLYEVAGIRAPRVVNGFTQDSLDGVSMAYTFDNPAAPGTRNTQFFDVMGSRGIYHDGWYACTFGPRIPWKASRPDLSKWNPLEDKWELYNLEADWSQAEDLAARMPEKVEQMKALFLVESARNKNLPIGGALWSMVLHPEDVVGSPYTDWTYSGAITRIPELAAPKLGKTSNLVTLEVDLAEKANGVLYALGAFSGGLSCYLQDGVVCYEYNLFEISRFNLRADQALPAGPARIEVESKMVSAKPGAPMDVTIRINGVQAAQGRVPSTAPIGFTANDCLDLGCDLGSPVSPDYYDLAPYKLEGTLGEVKVKYLTEK